MEIVIMAGGGGSRLWPLSRRQTPKQFLDLGSGQTLIEEAYARAQKLTDVAHIYVATNEQYRDAVKKFLPGIADDHVFYEPEKRDTTAAFAAIALRLEVLGRGDEPTIFMWSDHVFTNETEFLHDLRRVPEVLASHPDSVVILGHTPISAETGLGYIEAGEALPEHSDVFEVKAFKEKPDEATAQKYLEAGNYFWNLGYFSLRPSYLLEELARLNPELESPLKTFRAALQDGGEAAHSSAYKEFPKISIEYTFIEKTPRRLTITGDYGWSDIGNWATIQEIFGRTDLKKMGGPHIHVDSQNNYIYDATNRAVSLVGVKNTIVVITRDAILVTDRDHAHKVKQVVEKLEAEGKHEYL